MPRDRSARRPAGALAAAAAAVLLGGCGTAAGLPTGATGPASPSASPAVATAIATPSPAHTAEATAAPATATPRPTEEPATAPSTVQAGEADNGGTLTLRPGGTLVVVLHSTYWQFNPPSNPAVVSSEGRPASSPAPMGSCVPGEGCGTVTARFRALTPGRSTVSAGRTSCGEALRCTGNAGSWSVTVVVSG